MGESVQLSTGGWMGPLAGFMLGDVPPVLGVGEVPGVLLPTPAVNDMSRGKGIGAFNAWRVRQKAADGRPATHGRGLDVELRSVAGEEALGEVGQGFPVDGVEPVWGRYREAISRAEEAFGPCPLPVEPGRRTPWQASAEFVEWMMGLPAGWVTGCGLPYEKAMKVLGNAVVPRQAGFALAVTAWWLNVRPEGGLFGVFDEGRDVWVEQGGVRVDSVWPKHGLCVDGVAVSLPAYNPATV